MGYGRAVRLKPGAPTRDVTQVGRGDYIQTRDGWKKIASNTAKGAERTPRNWDVRTTDGCNYDMWQVIRYAKADDLE